jgi:hypothetical protein
VAFEMVHKNSSRASYGAVWSDGPAVAIGKAGLSFNRQFVQAFGLRQGDLLCLFIDKEKRRLGLKNPNL